ncbi:NAD-dependent epimerase/dehydratase family protein [Nakamurella flavida]|uniref:NAD-dependent epimerase/dehydratase family protein n=1 Tax=Nakamurella flavida TaxID=363630 RepID=A0A938YQH8_9ACTN|nr:NAD-dependent epimerase/dehydratase family protein [Nakamurella flavida]MBM9477597.1 NAD-dependent epimerase/dehydratase family protein [Nakamurella flavida]MDP9779145.1 nucleoside-diphosphate-sugar epimerase [Nakamurella flavida]
MKVLLTGASGMMGRATAHRLIARGDQVTVLQRNPAGLDCREVLGSLTDPAAVARAVAGQDAVLHMAAKVDVVGAAAEYHRVNVEGTATVVDACRTAGVGRLVNVSSPSVAHAGEPLVGVGAQPADPATAGSHYSRSKARAEQLALAADSPDLAVISVRPHLVWGPGDTQLVGRIVQRAARGGLPIIGTGAALIDTTYVDNAADAMVAALDACGPVHGEAFVVSNGEPRPVGEILDRICLAAGVPVPARSVPLPLARVAGTVVEAAWTVLRRRDTPPLTRFLAEQLGTAHWFDQRRTRQALDWVPQVPLDAGFARLTESLRG